MPQVVDSEILDTGIPARPGKASLHIGDARRPFLSQNTQGLGSAGRKIRVTI